MPEVKSPKRTAGWTKVAFGDVVRLCTERSNDPEADGFERYIGLEHLDPGELRVRRWGDLADGVTFTNVFRPGQVLFGKRRAYQRKVAVADFSGVCSGDIYVLEPKSNDLLPELLPFICQTEAFFEHAVGTSAGSLSPRTNWESLADFEFALPSIAEQRRLVGGLTASQMAVAAVANLRDQVSTLRLAAIRHFESQVHAGSNLNGLVTELESGSSPPSTGEEAGAHERGVLKVSAVGDWEFVAHEAKAVAPGDYDESVEVHSGDLLIARANADPDSVGRSCIVDSVRSGLMLSDKTWRAHLSDAAREVPYGVLAWTKCRAFRTHVRNQLNGTDAKNISKERFLAGPAPVVDAAFKEFDAQIRLFCAAARSTADRLADAQRCYQLVLERAIAQ